MFPEFETFRAYISVLRQRLVALRADESGYSTETVIVTAVLAACALAAVGYLADQVVSKAKGISL